LRYRRGVFSVVSARVVAACLLTGVMAGCATAPPAEEPRTCLLAGVSTGCATAPRVAEPRPNQPRPTPVVAAQPNDVAYWNQLATALAELAPACAGGPSQGLGSTGIAVPAACFFLADETTLNTAARSVVAAIARELNRASDREFWIDVHTPAGQGDAARKDAARASAMVAALVAAGVAPERLAAVVGVDDGTSSRVWPGGAFVEIVVVPIVND
jgi:outer membrane protein OmpA-like peptidoglycan-associated protein